MSKPSPQRWQIQIRVVISTAFQVLGEYRRPQTNFNFALSNDLSRITFPISGDEKARNEARKLCSSAALGLLG
jgi:hypothetical protein